MTSLVSFKRNFQKKYSDKLSPKPIQNSYQRLFSQRQIGKTLSQTFSLSHLNPLAVFLLTGLICLLSIPTIVQAQIRVRAPYRARRAVKRHFEKKGEDEARKGLKKAAYSDTIPLPKPGNRVNATFTYEQKEFKKNGKVKQQLKSKIALAKTGECYIFNLGEKDESRFLFDYNKNASFIVNPKDKTATKMPLINFRKMFKRLMTRQQINQTDGQTDNGFHWQKTSEKKIVNGYHCQKYVYKNDEGYKGVVWITKDINIPLADNYVFGAALLQLSQNHYQKWMIQNTRYFKNSDKPQSQITLLSAKPTVNKKYFDLSKFKISGMVDDMFR